MTKFTGGEWFIDKFQGVIQIVADVGDKWDNPTVCLLYEDATPSDSVTIGPWLEPLANAEANARLISKAPKLLALIKESKSLIERALGSEGDVFGVQHNEAVDTICEISKLLSEVEGETK